jgi:predicted regulator of Ras-like GTPase activity (Roadblock/LC7/MglB family)
VDDRSPASDFPELSELCGRLQRDAAARAVLVLDGEGRILGHAGEVVELGEPVLDALADLVVAVARPGALGEGDDAVAEVETLRLCAARLGDRATLAVVFDSASTLGLVRLRMKRARELILRTLEAR